MSPASTVTARETRRRWASLAYAVVVLAQGGAIAFGDAELPLLVTALMVVVGVTLAVLMAVGVRWGWYAAIAAEVVTLVALLVTGAVGALIIVFQALLFGALLHPALSRRDSWVHRWG